MCILDLSVNQNMPLPSVILCHPVQGRQMSPNKKLRSRPWRGRSLYRCCERM